MKCESLFSGKNKKIYFKMSSTNFLPNILSVKKEFYNTAGLALFPRAAGVLLC